MRSLLIGVIFAASLSPPASAWGDLGHRIICQIAFEELRPEIRARVGALIAIDPRYRTFAGGEQRAVLIDEGYIAA
jgi:hypothetical protein